jgi:hypothetical protein
MMEKLVDAGVGVLAFDITFRGISEFDEDFAAGARAMTASGTDVIVAVKTQVDGSTGAVSAVIAPEVQVGGVSADYGASGPWNLHLYAASARRSYPLSLVLRSLASYRLPGSVCSGDMDPGRREAILSYWEEEGSTKRAKRERRGSIRIGLTEVSEVQEDHTIGPERGDLVAYFMLPMPPDSVLEASTMEYGELFRASPEVLADRLGGKVVLVADLREGVDQHAHPDGRSISGCYGHALALDSILREDWVRRPTWADALWLNVVAAVAGLAIAVAWSTRRVRRYLAVVLVCAAFVLASMVAYRFVQYLVIPIVQIFALVVSCGLAAVVAQVQRRGHTSRL